VLVLKKHLTTLSNWAACVHLEVIEQLYIVFSVVAHVTSLFAEVVVIGTMNTHVSFVSEATSGIDKRYLVVRGGGKTHSITRTPGDVLSIFSAIETNKLMFGEISVGEQSQPGIW